MGKDLRVIFVKLVDRIHNIQTLHYHPKEEKRQRIAEETLKIYVPIAKRLGLFYYQQFLENGAFKILYPKEFDRIFSYLEKMLGVHDTITQKGVEMLQNLLAEEHIPMTHVIGRIKSPYRIFEKLQRKYNSTDISKVTDLIAFRIVTDNIGNCYNILGVIHAHYIPLIKKIKDYIAIPKSNEYKSIHTTILGMFDFPVEIQIRTEEMDDVAEY
ncbi:bifunctional (p)ppGpp synthetase/guanosine-3',5'-bis(diphosphate) 3'-pyrophosphohydrolase [Patescibacteria group bacterium]|nr:bifunctional (p)ppGpp synthetase/guanosine-3',5'-bis(diphosphate) 3'-pyrophosphohydrolase [Patescibacteria group bacterium]